MRVVRSSEPEMVHVRELGYSTVYILRYEEFPRAILDTWSEELSGVYWDRRAELVGFAHNGLGLVGEDGSRWIMIPGAE